MTVGELRAFLADLGDDLEVHVAAWGFEPGREVRVWLDQEVGPTVIIEVDD